MFASSVSQKMFTLQKGALRWGGSVENEFIAVPCEFLGRESSNLAGISG